MNLLLIIFYFLQWHNNKKFNNIYTLRYLKYYELGSCISMLDKNLHYPCTICLLFFHVLFLSMHKLSDSLSPLKLSVVVWYVAFFISAQTVCVVWCAVCLSVTNCLLFSFYPCTNCLLLCFFCLSLHKPFIVFCYIVMLFCLRVFWFVS